MIIATGKPSVTKRGNGAIWLTAKDIAKVGVDFLRAEDKMFVLAFNEQEVRTLSENKVKFGVEKLKKMVELERQMDRLHEEAKEFGIYLRGGLKDERDI